MVFALVPCEDRGGVDRELPPEVQHILSEFVDLMLEALPLAFRP